MAAEKTIQTWISKAAAGDRLATAKLIMIHHGRLLALARRRIGPELQARIEPEDILQQVYVDVMERTITLEDRGPQAFFAWLTKILESKLVDARRFHHARGRDVAREAGSPPPPSKIALLARHMARDSHSPSRVVARKELEGAVTAAMAGLPEDHRRVLELRFLQDLALEEVATAMGRSPGAVQMLSARALRKLRLLFRRLSRVR